MDNIKTVSAFFIELALRGVTVEILTYKFIADISPVEIAVRFRKGSLSCETMIYHEDYNDEEKFLMILKLRYEDFIEECIKNDVPIY